MLALHLVAGFEGELVLVLKSAVVFFLLLHLLLKRLNQAVTVLEIVIVGVALRNSLVRLGLLALHFQLQLLQFFLLRLVAELESLEVRLQLVAR